MRMLDPIPQFSYLIKQLSILKFSYIHLVEGRVDGNLDIASQDSLEFALEAWGNTSPVFLAGGFSPEKAFEAVDHKYADKDVVIVFGRYFISNPDLPYRLLNGIESTPYVRDTFYTPKMSEGYIDYNFSPEFKSGKA